MIIFAANAHQISDEYSQQKTISFTKIKWSKDTLLSAIYDAIETSAIRGFYKLTFNVYFQFKSDAMKEAVKTLRNLGYKVIVNQAEQILTISW